MICLEKIPAAIEASAVEEQRTTVPGETSREEVNNGFEIVYSSYG